MTLLRQIMEADLKNEEKNRVKPYVLTPQERNIISKWMVDAEIKETKMWYWFKILNLQADGYTEEGAREKVYQDILAKGNPKAAKLMREFQEITHPLKDKNQPESTPKSPHQT